MIYYLVTAEHSYTIDWFLFTWEPSYADRMEVLFYEDVPDRETFPRGTYIFSDLERLDGEDLEMAAALWDRLVADGSRVLNDPRTSLRRYDLLRTAHALGASGFGVYRVIETREPSRYPVFLRPERGHQIVSTLLHTRGELDDAIEAAVAAGHPLDELLMVEYLDTSDEHGIFRKYTCYKIGDRVFPHWLNINSDWTVRSVRHIRVTKEAEWAARWEYIRQEPYPYEDWARRMFAMAHIQYGRMDYSLLDGTPQIWEINTNPTVMHHYASSSEGGRLLGGFFLERFRAALDAVDIDTEA